MCGHISWIFEVHIFKILYLLPNNITAGAILYRSNPGLLSNVAGGAVNYSDLLGLAYIPDTIALQWTGDQLVMLKG
jgi:hypothetical protein